MIVLTLKKQQHLSISHQHLLHEKFNEFESQWKQNLHYSHADHATQVVDDAGPVLQHDLCTQSKYYGSHSTYCNYSFS